MIEEDKFITLRDGTRIHCRMYEKGQPIWIIATHGINEHLGRHDYLTKTFSPYFNVLRYDLRGHGESSGKRAYVNDFSEYVTDLDEIIYYLKENYKMKRYVLFGHSMGGLITAAYQQNFAKEEFYPERVFLSAPPVGIPGPLGKLVDLGPNEMFKSLRVLPSFPVKGMVDLDALSHDPRVKDAYLNDKLNSLAPHSRLLLSLVVAAKNVFSKPIEPKCPSFCAAGTEDKVVSIPAIKEYFSKIETEYELNLIEGGFHELHLEISRFRDPYLAYLKDCFMNLLE